MSSLIFIINGFGILHGFSLYLLGPVVSLYHVTADFLFILFRIHRVSRFCGLAYLFLENFHLLFR